LSHSAKLDDVARLAGVSPKTVSRVVNGEMHVRSQTKEAVERAIARLGYRPNMAARSLATSRSFLIGLVTPHLGNFYFHELHSSSIRACRERGLHLLIEQITDVATGALQSLEDNLRHMRFEGVILVPPISDNPAVLDLLDRLGIKYVRISPATHPKHGDSVSSDEAQGMQLLAEHLWSLGHRHIALATLEGEHVSARRGDLLRDALLEMGCHRKHIQSVALNWRETALQAGRRVAATLLSQRKRPSAIFGFADEAAAGVIGYALQHGLQIPRDLSVVGFDDSDLAQSIWPPLTTIRQPIAEMARAAVALLVERSPKGKVREVVCPVELVLRGSTGLARTSRT
jgi:LacI family transcriptional regulator